jgi:hypothetical protein
MTIRHVVMWRVRGATPGERHAHAARVCDALLSMQGQVPGMARLQVGLDVSGVDYACDVVLLADFDDDQALAGYADHPAHLHAKQLMADLRVARHQVDFVLPP